MDAPDEGEGGEDDALADDDDEEDVDEGGAVALGVFGIVAEDVDEDWLVESVEPVVEDEDLPAMPVLSTAEY